MFSLTSHDTLFRFLIFSAKLADLRCQHTYLGLVLGDDARRDDLQSLVRVGHQGHHSRKAHAALHAENLLYGRSTVETIDLAGLRVV